MKLRLVLGFCLIGFVRMVAAENWVQTSQSANLTLFERGRAGSNVREFKAVGVIDCPPEVLIRVLEDVPEYPRFMPYVKEARVLSKEGDAQYSYQRISPPLVGDRDYTIRVRCEAVRNPSGQVCYVRSWETANDHGPAERDGVTRVKITEGSWRLEPIENGRTRATYTVYSDAGGSLPSFLGNSASKTAIPQLFECVKKQARQPKYLAR